MASRGIWTLEELVQNLFEFIKVLMVMTFCLSIKLDSTSFMVELMISAPM